MIFLFLNSVLVRGQSIFSFHVNGWEKIGQFEKLEIGLAIPHEFEDKIENFLSGGEGINPYNFSEVIVEAYFTNSKSTYYREGFYLREIRIDTAQNTFLPDKAKFPYHIRFCPPEPGTYNFLLVFKVSGETKFNFTGSFTVNESEKRGLMTLGKHKHLKDYYNKSFVALGQNIPFCDYPTSKIEPDDFNRQRSYINDLADNGGNFVRVRLDPWSNEIELEELGVYGSRRKLNENFERQWHAYELDKTFELAEDRGLYIFLTLLGDYHFAYKSNFPFDWNSNPYRKIVSKPNDFFSVDGQQFEIYKNKLRYLMARYGYSANLAVIGLINETDHIETYTSNESFRKEINQWVKAVGAYLKGDQFYPPHLLTNGYSSTPTSPDPGIDNSTLFDIISVNHYSNSRRVIKSRHDDMVNKLLSSPDSKKPFIFGEIGTGICPPTHEDWFSDADFHNNIWASAMYYRAFGNGLYWWDWEQESHLIPEDKSIKGMQHRMNFRALSAFFTQSPPPFETEEFTSNWDSDLSFVNQLENRKIEWIENVNTKGTKGFGWVHNSDYYWINDPLRLTSRNCPTCIYGGMEAFYDSYCYNEEQSSVAGLNEPKGPYFYGKKHEVINLNGYKPLTDYIVEIWSCYGEGGLITTLQERSDLFGKIKFKRNLGVYPSDPGFGDPDFGFKVHLKNETFEKIVNVYPNPFQDVFILESEREIIGFKVYNIAGEELINTSISNTKFYETSVLATYPGGIYFLIVELTGNIIEHFKVVKL